MKLSQEQIAHLYEFTRQHYVEYYDLQTELVDHLANSIEERWQENPKLSFETALNVEFKKFGIFGFMDVVEQRIKALNKKYNQIVLNHLKKFFTIPKIFGTLLSIYFLYFYLINSQFAKGIITGIMLVVFIILILGIVILAQKKKRHVLKTGKKWMLNEIIFGYSSMAGMSYLVFQLVPGFDGDMKNEFFIMVYSILIIVMLLLGYIILIVIPSKADEYLKQTYPEYNLQKG
jgi:hypothetical protein